jgi:hypothetical protein
MNLNFKISELIHSDRAKQKGIDNMPDMESLDNILDLIYFCLQPIRDLMKKPMIITSGYRNKELNKLICGAENSQHMKGQAADFIIQGVEPSYIVKVIKNSNIPYDQLINEYDSWVHVSYVKGRNRRKDLKY